MAPAAGDDQDLADRVKARLDGYAEVEVIHVAELQGMTEGEAAIIADHLQQLLPDLGDEPDRGSGLVDQQRLFDQLRE